MEMNWAATRVVSPLDFEITDRVRPQGNFLVLRVNNTRGKDQVPTVNTDWWNYGGITRPVTLVECRKHLFRITLSSSRKARPPDQGWVQLNGPQLKQNVTIRIPEAGIGKAFQTDSKGRAEFSFAADLTPWLLGDLVSLADDFDGRKFWVLGDHGVRSAANENSARPLESVWNALPIPASGIRIVTFCLSCGPLSAPSL